MTCSVAAPPIVGKPVGASFTRAHDNLSVALPLDAAPASSTAAATKAFRIPWALPAESSRLYWSSRQCRWSLRPRPWRCLHRHRSSAVPLATDVTRKPSMLHRYRHPLRHRPPAAWPGNLHFGIFVGNAQCVIELAERRGIIHLCYRCGGSETGSPPLSGRRCNWRRPRFCRRQPVDGIAAGCCCAADRAAVAVPLVADGAAGMSLSLTLAVSVCPCAGVVLLMLTVPASLTLATALVSLSGVSSAAEVVGSWRRPRSPGDVILHGYSCCWWRH